MINLGAAHAQLRQLFKGCVWDGDLFSKDVRDALVAQNLVGRAEGYNVILPAGITYMVQEGLINSLTSKAKGG